jgi:hypothetical protein
MIDLALAVAPGQVFRFAQKQRVEEVMTAGGKDVAVTIDVFETMTYTIAAVRDDGRADVRVEFGDVRGTFQSSAFGTTEFDTSTGKEASVGPAIAAALRGITALAHARFEMTLDRRGAVVDVRGMRDALQKALKDSPAAGVRNLAGLLDDDGMKQQMQGHFARFADGPAAVGATWSVASEIKSPVAMKASTLYTLTRADAESAVVSCASTVRGTAAAADDPGTTSEGTISVSRRDGLPLSSETKVHTAKYMETKRSGAETPRVRLDMTVTATMERVADDAAPTPAVGAGKPK